MLREADGRGTDPDSKDGSVQRNLKERHLAMVHPFPLSSPCSFIPC
jgi:hypothetical protein